VGVWQASVQVAMDGAGRYILRAKKLEIVRHTC
jgi:hypothetical protein